MPNYYGEKGGLGGMEQLPGSSGSDKYYGNASTRPSGSQRVKDHCTKFWWLHLIIIIIVSLVITLPLIFVGFPRIAQQQLNRASLSLLSEQVTNPTPNNVQIRLVTQAKNPSPFSPRLENFTAALFLEDTEPNIKPFGYIQIPELIAGKVSNITVAQTLEIADQEQFARYNLRTLQSNEYRLAVRGKTKLHEGAFPVADVDFNQVITTKGLNGLAGFNITELNISLIPNADGTNANGTIVIPNQSNQDIFIGNVTSSIFSSGQLIGNATINNMRLMPGMNSFPMTSVTDQATVLGLITSKFPNGILPVQIIGTSVISNGQHLPYFESAFKQNVINTELNVGAALAKIGVNLGLTG